MEANWRRNNKHSDVGNAETNASLPSNVAMPELLRPRLGQGWQLLADGFLFK